MRMPNAHAKSKKRPRSPPSRWETEASDGDNADNVEAVVERWTKNRHDIRAAPRGNGIRHEVRPLIRAKDKATLRMKEPEQEREIQ